jgi:SAM-dependent methyltransferase
MTPTNRDVNSTSGHGEAAGTELTENLWLTVEALVERVRRASEQHGASLDAGMETQNGEGVYTAQADMNRFVVQILTSLDTQVRALAERLDSDSRTLEEARSEARVMAKRLETIEQRTAQRKLDEFAYARFEDEFRGTESEVTHGQAVYAELMVGRNHVVDLGCGRGEFLELLRGQGTPATGVDSEAAMVERCRRRGLDVAQADIFDYLSRFPDESLDGLFAGQVLEHLSPARVFDLLLLCADKLEPGGLMIAETVNPNCPRALANFYLDPTHERPLPARLLRYMYERRAFEVSRVIFSSPVADSGLEPRLESDSALPAGATAYQDYAVVAVRLPQKPPRSGNGDS